MMLVFLCVMVFFAAFVDSIAGGGGFISLTSYNVAGITGQNSLGTNKFSSCIGSTIAAVNFIRTKNYHLVSLIPSAIGALVGSAFGSKVALLVEKEQFSIILLIVTPVVAAITFVKKNFSPERRKVLSNRLYICLGLLIGLLIGFYDGFFGPGTGMFMQLAFIMILKLDPVKAAGNTRVANAVSNLSALIVFIVSGNVIYNVAIPCAICSVVGNLIGSQLAIRKEVKIIRPIMMAVVCLLFIKLLLDYFGVNLF